MAPNIPLNLIIMRKLFLSAIAVFALNSCQNEESPADSFQMKTVNADYTAACSLPVQTVSGTITSNTIWTNDRVWSIEGVVRVIGAKLTIQAGTFIKAKPLALGVATGILVITKTGQIDAQGTSTAPIVFTSYNLLDCNAGTFAAPGDFGGVVLLGDAPVNNGMTTNVIEGLGDQPNITNFYYGGSNPSHNTGNLNYIRIEFAGRILAPEDEVNGLTFGGVGNGTVVDHIQVSYSIDDSFEFFGGTVNAGHLVSFAPRDDNFDFDLGYTGTITKAIALASQDSQHSLSAGNPGSNGIELDNGNITTIITRPIISQLSIIGMNTLGCNVCIPQGASVYKNAIHIGTNAQIKLSNTTVTGYSTGIQWQSPSLPVNSTWSSLSIHGFIDPVLPLGTLLGFGSTASAASSAPTWGLTQPFFNSGTLNFTGSTGAFKTEANWTDTWTKFDNF